MGIVTKYNGRHKLWHCSILIWLCIQFVNGNKLKNPHWYEILCCNNKVAVVVTYDSFIQSNLFTYGNSSVLKECVTMIQVFFFWQEINSLSMYPIAVPSIQDSALYILSIYSDRHLVYCYMTVSFGHLWAVVFTWCVMIPMLILM